MTRDLERRINDLEDSDDRDGFHFFKVGGDPDEAAEVAGFYEWNAERGEYVNENGRTKEEPPGSQFEYNAEYSDSGDTNE